jgi:hypothetical protein
MKKQEICNLDHLFICIIELSTKASIKSSEHDKGIITEADGDKSLVSLNVSGVVIPQIGRHLLHLLTTPWHARPAIQ